MFPSPFGVHVLKRCKQDYQRLDGCKFPSPFGVHVLKFFPFEYNASLYPSFPSPFGVHVLKLVEAQRQVWRGAVSVPFRGSRSEIVLVFGAFVLFGQFPSPFGVHVLKLLTPSPQPSGRTFPSPFGVHVLKFNCVEVTTQQLRVSFRPLSGFTF